MITGRTNGGFEFELADSILENYEVTEALVVFFDSNKMNDFIRFKKLMFKGAEECEKRAADFVRDDDGTVKNADMITLVFDIWNAARDLKNS